MLSDPDIDSLARAALDDAVNRVREWSPKYFYDVTNGRVVLYGEEGSFRFAIVALPTIKKIIRECEKRLDLFNVTNGREYMLKILASTTASHLIASLGLRVNKAIDDAVDDSSVIAQALIVSMLNQSAPGSVSTDVRPIVRSAGQRARADKEALLLRNINRLPGVVARGPGRPPITSFGRELEREQYVAEIEAAYRKLSAVTGRKPTKTEVAEELGEGGINPRTGSDTRLNAFNNKLKRLKIDYAAIVASIETTL